MKDHDRRVTQEAQQAQEDVSKSLTIELYIQITP